MATDGIKIIDGDLAHDVYYTFMDLYDTNASLDEIKTVVEQLRPGDEDFYDEIFITAYALALWEIDELDNNTCQQVRQAITRRAFVTYLVEEEDCPSEARKRQRVLDRFWVKINQPNLRPRKRKNHKLQKKFVFSEGDVLTFQMPDGTYRATILLLISQYRGRCDYKFTFPTYISTNKPTLTDIEVGEMLGRSYSHPNFPEYKLGFDVVGISHKHLLACADIFEYIGHLEIKQEAKVLGAQGGAVDYESFIIFFSSFDNIAGLKKTAKTHPNRVFPVQVLTK